MKKEVLPGMYIEPCSVLTEKGTVEFDMSGTKGPVILSVHGGLGGADQARLMANWLDSSAYRILSPSRPGYLGTPLESGKTFEQQADLLAALLDHLQIAKVALLCLSAGGPPAYQFAIRHPDKVWALVAIDSVSGYYHAPEMAGPMTEAIFMSTLGQKIVKMIMEKHPKILLAEAFRGIGYFTKEQRKRQINHVLHEPQAFAFLKALLDTMNPYAERKKGNENDMQEFLFSSHVFMTKDEDISERSTIYAFVCTAPQGNERDAGHIDAGMGDEHGLAL